MIWAWGIASSGGGSGGVEDLDQFFGVRSQSVESRLRKKPRIADEFDPEQCLVRLFEHDGNLVDDVRPRFPAQSGTIVGSHRATATRNLCGRCAPTDSVREMPRHLCCADRKAIVRRFNSSLSIRSATTPNQKSSIVNHKS